MAAEGNNNIRRYIYRGEEGEVIPRDGKIIVIVREDVTVILARAFRGHRNIIEVICHENVEKIEEFAFGRCSSLKRMIMPGVRVVEQGAFGDCCVLTDAECGKLEIIKQCAFNRCMSLRSINLPSTEIVKGYVFNECTALMDVKFSNKLRRIEKRAFLNCRSLERITIPLKDGLITDNDVFMGCENLEYVHLVEGALHETIDALFLDGWRKDMNEQIDSINQILPNAFAGIFFGNDDDDNEGKKTRVIRGWIRSVLRKIIHYQAKHQRFVNEASLTLHHALPHDIVMNNVLPFLELSSYTFEVEDDEDEESDT